MADDDQQATDPSARSPFELLLAIQDEDLLADQLRHRRAHLPEHLELATLETERNRNQAAAGLLLQERSAHAARQDGLEREIDETTKRINSIEQRLREGVGASFRDQEAMVLEVTSLRRRRDELEEAELEVMEILEPIDVELAALDTATASIDDRRTAATGTIATAGSQIDAELAELRSAREPLAAALAGPILDEYERLRARLDGIGAARLVHGSCSGCHLSLPSTEIDRVRHAPAGEVSHCDQCGRILIP